MADLEQTNIERTIETSKKLFNAAVGEQFFTDQNLKIGFFTPENGVEVYEQFCREYFPRYLAENYRKQGYMQSFLAQAFCNGGTYGILVSLRSEAPMEQWPAVILHEMSHIFCIEKECNGENFYQSYCGDNAGSFTAAGYAVWREFVADYMAAHIFDYLSLSTAKLRETVRELDADILHINPDAKMNMSRLLAHVFWNRQVRKAKSGKEIIEFLAKNRVFSSKTCTERYYQIINHMYSQLSKPEYWKINVEFIDDLGELYLTLISQKAVDTQKNN